MVYPNKKFTFPDLTPDKMKIDIKYANKLLGLNLKESDVKNLLERMGYGYENCNVLVPKYRADVLHQIDLVEDIAIAYGYENFNAEISKVSTIGEEDSFEKFKNQVAEAMTTLGFLETSSFHLTSKDVMNKKMLVDIDCIELLNAANVGYDIMRAWVLPGLMKILGENTRYDYPQKIFEIGTVFKNDTKTETGIVEFIRLACTSCHKDVNYTEVKQYIDSLISSFGLECKVKETEHPSFIPGRVGRLSVKGKDIAYIGEIHPKVISNFRIEQPICAFELNLTELYNIIRE